MSAAEEWRPAKGFPDYLVSDFGRVMRVTPAANNFCRPGRILRTRIEDNGYERVNLHSPSGLKRVCVHALVCEAFHGPKPTPAHEVAHRDGVRSNNRAGNVRWLTRKQNHAEKRAHGTAQTGERNPNSKHSFAVVQKVRSDPRSLKVVAAELGLNYNYAWAIKNRRVWKDAA